MTTAKITPTPTPRTREIPTEDILAGMVLLDPARGPMMATLAGPSVVEQYSRSPHNIRDKPMFRFGADLVPVVDKLKLPPLSTVRQVVYAKKYREAVRENIEKVYRGFTWRSTLSIGMDPEVFVTQPDGTVIPAWEFLKPRDKDRVFTNTPYDLIQFPDGVGAEFTTLGRGCLEMLTGDVKYGLAAVRVAARAKYPGAKLSLVGQLPVPEKILKSVNPALLALGCSPSSNAYGEEPLQIPDPTELRVRTIGWHMHFGIQSYPRPVQQSDVIRVVKFLDGLAGVIGVSVGEGVQHRERRRLYGRAGEYRYHAGREGCLGDQKHIDPKTGIPKGYITKISPRLEYRPPDACVMGAHPATFMLMWDFTRVVFRLGLEGYDFLLRADEDNVRTAMNEYDVPLARRIISDNEPLIRALLHKVYYDPTGTGAVAAGMKVFKEGISAVVTRPMDVDGNWFPNRPEDDGWSGASSYARWSHNGPIVAGGKTL